MSLSNNLPHPERVITGHDKDGLSIIEAKESKDLPVKRSDNGMAITFCYATQGFPVNVSGDQDLAVYTDFKQNLPGIVVPNGSAARLVDFPPNFISPMHRSPSVNYNVVVEGSVKLITDSGQSKILKRGDVVVQRGANHAWANTSETEWARITAVSVPAELPNRPSVKGMAPSYGPPETKETNL